MRCAFALLLAALLAQCGKDDLLVDTASSSLPAEVRLRVGQSVLLPREGYGITFEEVTADSRCPTGVVCVWAGDGAARLTLRDRTAVVVEDTLHTTLDPRWVQFRSILVRLKKLDPYPVYNVPPDSSKFVVTLEIDRAAQGHEGNN